MTDRDTNKVFFSAQFSGTYRKARRDINEALRKHNIDVGHDILGTKDIWARDYMPIQVGRNKFMRYIYNPDYLENDEKHKTKKFECEFLNGKEVVDCNLVLDGGNVVVCGDKMILTEKVFCENSMLNTSEITRRLEEASGKQVIWIPCDPYEIKSAARHGELPFCHADGILHAIDDDTILLANYKDYDVNYRERLMDRLLPHFKIEELEFGKRKKNENCWVYINYLQIGNVVLMPTYNEETDAIARKKLSNILHTDTIIPIDTRELSFKADIDADNVGGSLHCVSWNVYDSDKQS